MLRLIATLQTFTHRLVDGARSRAEHDGERGNVTMEHVLWAVAVIAIVGTVVAVITQFVTNEAAKIG